MIVIENLVKKFGEQVAVNIPSLKINKGDVIGLVGNNGAGKLVTFCRCRQAHIHGDGLRLIALYQIGRGQRCRGDIIFAVNRERCQYAYQKEKT